MSARLAAKVELALRALFGAAPAEDGQPATVTLPDGDGESSFPDRARCDADDIDVEPVSVELREGCVAVAFLLSEDPADELIRSVTLQVAVHAREYEQIVVAGEFLAALPRRLTSLIQLEPGLPFAGVDDGEAGQERDEEGIYSMGRSFTLLLESE